MNREKSAPKLEHLLDEARNGALNPTRFYQALLELPDLTALDRIKCIRDAFGLTIEAAKRLAYEIEGVSGDEWVLEIASLDAPFGGKCEGETDDPVNQPPQ